MEIEEIEKKLTEAERELTTAINIHEYLTEKASEKRKKAKEASEKYEKAMEEVLAEFPMGKLGNRVAELKEKISKISSTRDRIRQEIARLEWNLSTMPNGDEVCPESASESIKKIKAQSNYEILVKRKSLEAELEKLKKFMTG